MVLSAWVQLMSLSNCRWAVWERLWLFSITEVELVLPTLCLLKKYSIVGGEGGYCVHQDHECQHLCKLITLIIKSYFKLYPTFSKKDKNTTILAFIGTKFRSHINFQIQRGLILGRSDKIMFPEPSDIVVKVQKKKLTGI